MTNSEMICELTEYANENYEIGYTSIKSKYPQIAEIWERLLLNGAIDEHTRGVIRCAYIRLILSEQKDSHVHSTISREVKNEEF